MTTYRQRYFNEKSLPTIQVGRDFYYRFCLFNGRDSVPSAEEAKQIEEKIDEIEIDFANYISLFESLHLSQHLLDFVHIESGKTRKDDHTDNGEDKAHSTRTEEQIHDSGQNQTDQEHKENTTPLAQIFFGKISPQSHGSEHTGCNKKCGRNARHRIHDKDTAQCHSIQNRIDRNKREDVKNDILPIRADRIKTKANSAMINPHSNPGFIIIVYINELLATSMAVRAVIPSAPNIHVKTWRIVVVWSVLST